MANVLIDGFEKRKADKARAEAFRKEQEAKAEQERIAELEKGTP